MASKPISQREARRLQKRCEVLASQIRDQRRIWGQDYPGGIEIARCTFETGANAARVARKLGHAVVLIGNDTSEVRFVALPHPSEGI